MPKRLLVIYDLKNQPLSIGDVLTVLSGAMIFRQQNNLSVIDFAFVYDRAYPTPISPFSKYINADNFYINAFDFLNQVRCIKQIGSTMIFDEYNQLNLFLERMNDQYILFPDLDLLQSGTYLHYLIHLYAAKHYRTVGHLPNLVVSGGYDLWASEFLARYSAGRVPVTVQLRRNPTNPLRDSDYSVWTAFFAQAVKEFPVTFFVVCAAHEIDPTMRNLDHVVLIKDHHTNICHDLALLQAARLHMGASSGPATILYFSDQPYALFGFDNSRSLDQYSGSIYADGDVCRTSFGTRQQLLHVGKENVPVLMQTLSEMFFSLPDRMRPLS